MNTIAERIKFAMKAKNKKQVDIVKDTGISKGRSVPIFQDSTTRKPIKWN